MHNLRHSWGKLAHGDFGKQRVLSQVEWNEACCQELLPMAIKNDTCLYQNIQHFFRDEMQETVQMLLSKPHLAVEILGPLIASKKCMKKEAYCLTQTYMCNQASKTSRSWNLLPSLLQERKWPFADGSRNHFYIGMDWLESRTAGTHYSI